MKSDMRGFTLIELLVVISIFSMLSTIVLASLQGARERARIGSALLFDNHMYHAWGAEALAHLDFSAGSDTPDNGSAFSMQWYAPDCDPLNGTWDPGELTCNNAYVNSTPSGQNGYSYTFHNDSRRMSGFLNTPQVMKDYTISVWVNISSPGGRNLIAGYCSNTSVLCSPSGTIEFKLYVLKDNSGPDKYLIQSGNDNYVVRTITSFDLNKWYLVSASYKSATNKHSVYVDGKRIPDDQLIVAPIGGASPNNGLFNEIYIGGDVWMGTPEITVDNVSIYPYAIEGN